MYIEFCLKQSSILEKDSVMSSETNTSFPPACTYPTPTQQYLIGKTNPSSISVVASLFPTTDTPPTTPFISSMSTLLCELCPRKYKWIMEMESEWCNKNQRR